MSFSKTLVSGEHGAVVASMSNGVVAITANASASLGGGAAAGVAKVSSSNSIEIGVGQAIDLGLDLAAHQYPAVAPLIEGLKAAIDMGMKQT